jgi:hypothetical protein
MHGKEKDLGFHVVWYHIVDGLDEHTVRSRILGKGAYV